MVLKELIDTFTYNTAINIYNINKKNIVTSCTGVIGSESVISDEKLNSEIAWIEYDNATLNIGIWTEQEMI
jgi:hypothetical protein